MEARARDLLHRLENGVLVAIFAGVVLLPLVEAAARPIKGLHITGAAAYLQHLVLWLSFIGGLIVTRERKHLRLSTAEAIPEGRWREAVQVFAMGASAAVCAVLVHASWEVVRVNRLGEPRVLAIGLPEWISELVMPVALGLIALRFVWNASDRWGGRLAALAIAPLGLALDWAPSLVENQLWALVGLVVLAALLGAPVFVAMAGLGMLLVAEGGSPVSSVAAEVYRLISSPALPAIPLLTACGYVLAESRAAERLVRFFKALFGWMPGGVAVLVAGVCALFTTFTGGSGVTIIALGGLAFGILQKDRYPEGFSLGLITASGSLGLLFPPSLPVILYAVVTSQPGAGTSVSARDLYLAGLLPGLLLVLLVAAWGIHVGRKLDAERPPFDPRELGAAAWAAKWELSVPVVVIVLFMAGWASIVEASAFACAYSVVVECFVTRDVHPTRDLPQILVKAGVVVGAVLILLSAAMGLSGYLVLEQIPDQLLEWVQGHISSQWVFLLALNGLLLVLGSVLEIYAAIVILPPIIAPLAVHYGVDPVHMGIIFLANIELGFLLPPVGLNLFLSASRFDRPMTQLYRHVVPYLLILGAGVLAITYVPQMSVGVLKLFDSGSGPPVRPGGQQGVDGDAALRPPRGEQLGDLGRLVDLAEVHQHECLVAKLRDDREQLLEVDVAARAGGGDGLALVQEGALEHQRPHVEQLGAALEDPRQGVGGVGQLAVLHLVEEVLPAAAAVADLGAWQVGELRAQLLDATEEQVAEGRDGVPGAERAHPKVPAQDHLVPGLHRDHLDLQGPAVHPSEGREGIGERVGELGGDEDPQLLAHPAQPPHPEQGRQRPDVVHVGVAQEEPGGRAGRPQRDPRVERGVELGDVERRVHPPEGLAADGVAPGSDLSVHGPEHRPARPGGSTG